MNKTEAAFADQLEARFRAGDIKWYKFEGIKLKLADKTTFTPDFFILTADDVLECIEVKGAKAIFYDDAKVKIKVAADTFPFKFTVVYPVKAGWAVEEI